jgi:integrase
MNYNSLIAIVFGAAAMDLKPLFPEQLQMESISRVGMEAEDIIISLPVVVDEELKEGALSDLKRAFAFLYETCGNSNATYKAYRSAIERLFFFLWFKQHKTLNSLTKRDIIAFIDFSQNPDPEWIGIHGRRFHEGVPNSEWRPYAIKPSKGKTQAETPLIYKTSKSTITSVMARISSFLSLLVENEYIPSNPVAALRNKRQYVEKKEKHPPVKRLSIRQMEYCKAESEIMANENPEIHERTRFLIHFMLSLYLRISEVVPGERHTPQMKNFFRDSEGDWWFRVIGGKGDKSRLVAMSDEDVATLARYRQSRNLHPYPSYNEDEPLITRVRGTGQVTSDRNIRIIIQNCFDRTKRRLMEDGFDQDAHTLHEATVHWLRHTGISEDLNANERPLSHVADDAGHQDLKTTSIYVDSDLHDRHRSKQRSHAPSTLSGMVNHFALSKDK